MPADTSIIQEQLNLCSKYHAEFLSAAPGSKVGISRNVRDGVMPINGLRYQPEGDTSGWYIWAGEEYSESEDFFEPLHISHLNKHCPLLTKYLGLSAGWRFLVDDSGYEDVWKDEALLPR
jgi:hypothetical protein